MASPAKVVEATTACAQCQQQVPVSAMQRHVDWQCPAAEVSCGECDGTYTRGTLAKHMQFDCKNTDSDCPLAPYGCKAKIAKAATEAAKKSAFDEHMSSAVDAHTKLLHREHAMVLDYRRALQKQVDARDFEVSALSKEAAQLSKQLLVAKALRGELAAQLAGHEKHITAYTAYMTEKIKADPTLAPGAAAADEKKTAAAGTAAAGTAAAGSDAKDHKHADKSLQGFADEKRGAEALIVHYKARPATAPALVDLLPKLKVATTSITQFGRVTLTDVTNIALLCSYPLAEYRTFAERKIAAEYIAAYYAVRSNSVADEEAGQQLMEEQRVNGALVWGLTCQAVPSDVTPADANAMDQLALDFAKVLADPRRIAFAFDRVVSRGILNDDVLTMWMSCAFLGRWSLAKELTNRAKEQAPDALELNHYAAQQNHSMPDMSILLPLVADAADGKALPDTDVADLKFAAYEVRSMVLQLLTVDFPLPDVAASIKAEYAQFPEGKDLVVTGQNVGGRVMLVQGAFVQMRSVAFPMPLVGPFTGNKMWLIGEFDAEAAERVMGAKAAAAATSRAGGETALGNQTKNTERYALTRVDSKGATSTWQGNLLMKSMLPTGQDKVGELKTTFKVTLTLFERDLNDPDIHAALGAPRLMGEDEDDGAAPPMPAAGGAVLN